MLPTRILAYSKTGGVKRRHTFSLVLSLDPFYYPYEGFQSPIPRTLVDLTGLLFVDSY